MSGKSDWSNEERSRVVSIACEQNRFERECDVMTSSIHPWAYDVTVEHFRFRKELGMVS